MILIAQTYILSAFCLSGLALGTPDGPRLGGLGGGSFGLGYGPGPAYGYAAGPLAFNNNCRDGCFYSKYRNQCVGNFGSFCDQIDYVVPISI